jgi:hypothetical protein
MCGNEIYKEYLSPNGELKAVIFQRDCGATTGFSTQISIIKADSNLKNESGNIYIVNGHPSRVAPQLSWSSSDELIIFKLIDGSEHKAEKQWSSSNTGVRTLPLQAPGKAGGAIPE